MEALSVPELNRQVVTRYFQEFWTNGNADIVDELCDDNVTIFYPMHGRMVGKTAAKEVIARFKQVSFSMNWVIRYANSRNSPQSFPDVSFRLLSPFPLIAESDYVVARWFGGGKHTGPAFYELPVGSLPTPNTGKEMRFSGTTIYRLQNGKIIEETGEESGLVALQQLGLIKMNDGFAP
ncbi:hypothetical protein TGAMA5MH_09055 [Trichoderma gamsii]|uniref:SnoaL-like domain-containing protein n=1 Tax=Trichoderma gamsii TaxID=398673 RepID=A0A2K0SZY3_9HYPO|nr:hypothetical protein TGAMA5MH_09055 [Trichoderma gamsii]